MAELDAHSPFMMGPIREIVAQVNPGLSILKQAAEFVNTKLDLVLYYILNAVSKLDQDKAIGASDIEQLARATLQPTMAQWAIQEARAAVQAFDEADKNFSKDEKIQETGLIFPTREIEILLAERHPNASIQAAIFLTAVVEYVCADLLQASGNRCIAGERGEIIGLTDIVQTMTEDEELSKLFFVVSSETENLFLKRQPAPSENAPVKRSGTLLVHPSKRKNTLKIDNKPFPVIDVAFPSKISAKDQGIDEIKAWEPPPSWNLSQVAVSASVSQIIDGQQPNADSEYASIYGGSRPLSMSIGMDSLIKITSKDDNIFEKIRQVTPEAPPPIGRKDPRRRKSAQFSSYDDLTKSVPTLSIAGKESEEAAMRNPSRNLHQSPHVGEAVVIRVNLPDSLKTKVEVPKDMTCGELLRYVVQKRCMKFDEYLIKSCEQLSGPGDEVDITLGEELDINLLVGDLKVNEVSICTRAMNNSKKKKEAPVASIEESPTLYVSEGGKDVLVMEMHSGRAQIVAGTIDKLIERMADESRQDSRYIDCILLTYRFYMKPMQIFEQLVLRFMIQPPEGATTEELEYFDEWQKPIQRKVINVIRWWVENYWQDFNNNVVLLGRLLEFGELIRNDGFGTECEQIEASMLAQLQAYRNLRTPTSSGPAKDSLLLTFQPSEVATQLNLWNFELFRNIQPVEYVNNVLTKDAEMFPCLDLFIKRFELESFWVATEICKERELRRRVMLLEFFIRTAKFCRDAKNYFSTFSIVGGLNLSCVQRLKTTWANIPARSMEVFHSLEELMSPYQNMKNYREKMLSSHPPIIPVLPVYLKDLLFTHDGNKTLVNKLVNLGKFKMIANQVRQIVALAAVPFEEQETPNAKAVREYIKNPIVVPDLMKLSQMCKDHDQ